MKVTKSYHRYALLPAAVLVFTSCEKKAEITTHETPSNEQRLAQADEAAALLTKRLGSELKKALKSGGPESALQVCQQIAQPLTESTNTELDQISITRTSLKVRNPKNEPSELDRKVMNRWLQKSASGAGFPTSEIDQREDGSVVVYKPILTQQMCLKCHGDPVTFSSELTSLLKKHYPADQATGFIEGSLRGVFKISFPNQ